MSRTPRRDALLPHMTVYDEAFSDSGGVAWSPYTIFFHPRGFSSPVVNTDPLGFRVAHDPHGAPVSPADPGDGPVSLVAGSSTAFGIGAGSDAHTLASALAHPDRTGRTWLNVGGRSFNAMQEYLLMAVHQHRLPAVEQIVLLSGFNNLGLARQPADRFDDHGAFFMWRRWENLREEPAGRGLFRRRGQQPPVPDTPPRPLDEQIDAALDGVGHALTLWAILAQHLGARLTYVLQPLANWVREPTAEERVIFDELDEVGGFTVAYGDILTERVHRQYSDGLAELAAGLGVGFVDSVPLFAEALGPADWAYVDRIHFTDAGHARFADVLASAA